MWRFESVLIRGQNPKQPPQTCLCHLMPLMLMLPGRMTFRHVRRYRPSHEQTLARWFARDVDFVSRNHAAIVDVVPHRHEHVLAVDPSVVPTRGKHTYGLDMCWNGAHSRAEQGLESATRAWMDGTPNRAYTLRVEQTSPAPQSGTEETRIDTDVAHLARVVTTQPVPALTYLAVDGYVGTQTFGDGVGAVDLPVIGTLRRDAHLRRLSSGPRGAGPGRPTTDEGQVDGSHLAHVEPLDAGDADITRPSQVGKHPQLQRHLPLVGVRHVPPGRYALRFSTDVARSAQTLYRYDQARFPSALLFRDATQFTGLRDCQARSADKWRVHCNARLSAVRFAKLEARQSSDTPQAPFSMASLKRRYVNQHLGDRMFDH